MSNTTYIIIGAVIIVALIAVALARKSKKKKAEPPSVPVVTPAAEVPQPTPDIAESPFILEPSTSPLEPASSTSVEVWNQTDFQVVVAQQDMRITLPAQGRARMDSRFPLTATPKTAGDAEYGLSLHSGDTPNLLIIRAID